MNGIRDCQKSGSAQSVNPPIGIGKRCSGCGEKKPFSDFRKYNDSRQLTRKECRKCENLRYWQKKHPDEERSYEKKNKKDSVRKWRTENPDKVRIFRKRATMKRRSLPKGRLGDSMGSALRKTLRGEKLGIHWELIVGFTSDQLKIHLEKQFTEKMSWANYGSYWSVDHIIPISVFSFEKPEDVDFKRCWSLKNLRPLSCTENSQKKNKCDIPYLKGLEAV